MSGEPAFQALRPAKRKAPPAARRIFDHSDPASSSEPLKNRLETLRAKYAGTDASSLLRAMIKDEFAGKITTVSSFGSESVVLLHLISEIDPSVPVIFLNTGKLFGETMRYRDRLQEKLGLIDVRAIGPHPDDLKALDPEGTLWSREPDSCCNIRKVLPLRRAIAKAAESPGDSMPIKLISGGSSRSVAITKSLFRPSLAGRQDRMPE